MAHQAARDFSNSTLRALGRRGIAIVGTQYIPDFTSALPFANGEVAYKLDDNGTGRVRTFAAVLAIAKGGKV